MRQGSVRVGHDPGLNHFRRNLYGGAETRAAGFGEVAHPALLPPRRASKSAIRRNSIAAIPRKGECAESSAKDTE